MIENFAGDAQRWAAVLRRDRAADGAFLYSVKTTGVYCRPSCPARRPRPVNVAFHLTCAAAEQAGFRPCRRCRPDEAPPAERHAALAVRACRAIEASDRMPDLASLAAAAGVSRFHFLRVFKAATGLTPRAYATARRADRVRAALPAEATVTDAIYAGGFQTSSRFYEASAGLLGMAPSAFRRGGAGVRIRFATAGCSLGSILVAATAKGLCAILLGDDPDALVRDLRERFPRADLAAGEPDFQAWVATVIGFVEAPALGLDLPLDVAGTAFQHRVWQALRDIPPGSTATYAEIASSVGAPGASRAVAGACAANPLAVAIPCHRVVRTDGTLSGYRWGVERKRALIAREAAAVRPGPPARPAPSARGRTRQR